MQKLVKKLSKPLQALVLTLLMTACSNQATTVTSGCSAFGLIYASRKDSVMTKRQILTHNKTYEAVCVNWYQRPTSGAR